MHPPKIVAAALVLFLPLLMNAAPAVGQGGTENTETHQNQDGTWTGTTTHPDGSKTVTDMDKDRHKTHETQYDAKGKKTEESEWAWNTKEKQDVRRKRHIYPHKDDKGSNIAETEYEYDENGVLVKETGWGDGYVIVDTYVAGKRVKREKIVDGKVVRTEHFDKDGNLIQHSIAQTPPPDVVTPSSQQGGATAQLVGVVYDKDSRPGDQVTMIVTTDPGKYRDIPALGVVDLDIPKSPGAAAQTTLEGVVVDLGDGRKQRADHALIFKIPENATTVPLIITLQGSAQPIAQVTVPVAQGPSPIAVTDSGKASDFHTPPVVQTTSTVQGPLSGNAGMTQVTVDNQPAHIVAETPRSVVFDLPPQTTPGAHTLTLEDGSRTASASIVKVGLVMQAGQLHLERGQSTTYKATVQLGPLPDSVWQHGGSSPELVNPGKAAQLVPGFRPPQPGEPAAVLFRIENASRDTVTIKPSQNEAITRVLNQQDFRNGQFTESGTIQSKKSGGFTINATVLTFFAPIACGEPEKERTKTKGEQSGGVSIAVKVWLECEKQGDKCYKIVSDEKRKVITVVP